MFLRQGKDLPRIEFLVSQFKDFRGPLSIGFDMMDDIINHQILDALAL
jgi:hypothetical protein